MSDDDPTTPTATNQPGSPATPDEPTAALREALDVLEAKLGGDGTLGLEGLEGWLGDVDALVARIRSQELEGTREEIRALVDRLLDLNAQIQMLGRMKRLLS